MCGRGGGGGEGAAGNKEVEKFLQVNLRQRAGRGTVGLHPRPPSSAACLLCGLGRFSFPSDLPCPHLHRGGSKVGCIRGEVEEKKRGGG